MGKGIKTIWLWTRTVSRMTWRQRYSRLLRLLKYKLIYPTSGKRLYPPIDLEGAYPSSAKPDIPPGLASAYAGIKTRRIAVERQTAEKLLQGKFDLLNVPYQFKKTLDWHFSPASDPLWNYTLHYFEWADPLLISYAVTSETRFYHAWLYYARHWIANNPPGRGLGWHPYPISRRLLSWMKASCLLEALGQASFPAGIHQSILQQAGFLARNLEFDLLNNHLIANAAALAWAGGLYPAWKAAEKWREVGFATLWSEVQRQVNEEGFLAERSPSYQRMVLADVAEAVFLADSLGVPVPAAVRARLEAMPAILEALRSPQGGFPQLNDAVCGYPDLETGLLGALLSQDQLASPAAGGGGSADQQRNAGSDQEGAMTRIYPESGLGVFRGGQSAEADHLLFDFGSPGPAWNPGHSHAGALSFTLSSQGRSLIVDPGAYSYHEEPWRSYFRSSRAHNTLVVDGLDQSEMWGSFRVGYRAGCRLLAWESVRSPAYAIAEQDGYSRLRSPVIHRRKVVYRAPQRWQIIDEVEGAGSHQFEAYFHFPPEAEIFLDSPAVLRAGYGGGWYLQIALDLPSGSKPAIETGWVSYGWYRKEPAPVLCCRWVGSPPARWEYNLHIIDARTQD